MWQSKKPSNIALIKYMGKSDVHKNKPSNASLSWTIPYLTTEVELRQDNESGKDQWQLMTTDFPFKMSAVGRQKYLNHLQRVKDYYDVKSHFVVSSGNNFPADCGIASSASSFAALTDAAIQACVDLSQATLPSPQEQAQISALGSGSSCRSFLQGWVHWDGEQIQSVDTQWSSLLHMVVILGAGTKTVSSSEAHQWVTSSLLYQDRAPRAEQRLQYFLDSLKTRDWGHMYEIAWAEFWDMHALFETSTPSFGYFLPDTMQVLSELRRYWQQKGDGPLVTMDAGPNVHLLWREDQRNQALQFYQDFIARKWTCLSNFDEVGFAQV
jgi:diphosphomevalonate decarboxylase